MKLATCLAIRVKQRQVWLARSESGGSHTRVRNCWGPLAVGLLVGIGLACLGLPAGGCGRLPDTTISARNAHASRTTIAVVTAWVGYRLWRRPSRDLTVVAACLGAFTALTLIIAILRGSLSPFPQGFTVLVVAAVGGILPISRRDPL